MVARIARFATAVGLVAAGAGLVLLLVNAASEAVANPGSSIVDGYWLGRLPWTPLGVVLVIGGSTVTAAAGSLAALVGHRYFVLLPLLMTVFWWIIALEPYPVERGCNPCPAYVVDPVSVAYSSPEETLVVLVLPAAIVGVMALFRPRGHERSGGAPYSDR